MGISTGNAIVDWVGTMNFEGNITPHTWYQTVKYPNGKANHLAINILSDIVYWYRPTIIREENNLQALSAKKKFKSDLLQRSYEQLADFFGISKRQATDAVIFLEKLGAIKRDLRTIIVNGVKMSNVLFIELLPKGIQKLTFPELTPIDERDSYPDETGHPPTIESDTLSHYNGTPPTLKRDTNTESTTKITTKITTKTVYREFVTLTPKEYDDLVVAYGKDQTEGMLDILDNYKGANGKTYKSDYRAILNWVVTRWNEKQGVKPNGKTDAARKFAEENGIPF